MIRVNSSILDTKIKINKNVPLVESDEEDPLDAYMKDLEKEAKTKGKMVKLILCQCAVDEIWTFDFK